MSNIDKQALRDAAKEVIAEGGAAWFDEGQLSDKTGLDIPFTDAAFIASASPETVLALLDELEAAEKRGTDMEVACELFAESKLAQIKLEAALEKAQQRIAELEARTVKLPSAWWVKQGAQSLLAYEKQMLLDALIAASVAVDGE